MPRIVVLLLLFIVSWQSAFAQKEAWNWFLSDSAGIHWVNGKTPTSVDWYKLRGEEGSGAISDSLGNLLFYTNGVDLYNAKHQKLNKDFDLGGDWSSTQGKLILKHQESNLYHVFTNNYMGLQKSCLYHSSFRITNDTVQFVVKKEIVHSLISEGIAAVNHQNGRDIIVINHSLYGDTFFFYILTRNGLEKCIKFQTGSSLKTTNINRATDISFSPTGNLLSFATSPIDVYHSIFKFNTQIVNLNNEISNLECDYFTGIFSDNDSFMYVDPNNYSYAQYSLKNWDRTSIINSRKTLYNDPKFLGGCARNAPGGRILITREKQKFISIVNDGNKPYPQCDFVNKTVTLVQGTCRFGNFNTNQSYFYTPAINYKYKQDCNTNEFLFWGVDTFAANAYRWEIKKGNSISKYNTKSLNHQFTDTGIWQVKYVATNGSRTDSVSKDIEIFPILKSGFLGKDIGYCGNALPLAIQGPLGMNCYTWQKPHGIETYVDHIAADTAGMYILETCNPVFCTYVDTLLVYEKAEPDAPQISRIGDSLYVTNPEPGVAYHWFKANVFTNSVGPAYKVTDTAWYKVRGVAPINCIGPFDSINVKTLQNRVSLQHSIVFYPNPAMDDVFLQHVPLEAKILLRDVTGRLVYETVAKQSEMQIALTQLPAGNYQLTIETTDQRAVYNVVKL
jgi:hypothetical protein